MTRTGLSARLNAHKPEPFVEINPADAERIAVADGSLVLVVSRWGNMLGRASVTPKQQPGSIFVPMHWTEQLTSRGRVGALVNPAVDPHSGQPESKHTPVWLSPFVARHYLFIMTRQALELPEFDYRVKVRGNGYWLYHLATRTAYDDVAFWVRSLLPEGNSDRMTEWIEYSDPAAGIYRAAQIGGDRLQSCIFVSSHWRLPETGWLQSLFGKAQINHAERLTLLSGKPPQGQADVGRTVCACFNVGEKTILEAIAKQQLADVAAIGRCLGAGTGCGSCLPELKELLRR